MATPNDLQEHLAVMISQKRRKVKVSLRNYSTDERSQLEEAKDKDTDPCISNAVFKVVQRVGVPIKRTMAMRWILTWKRITSWYSGKRTLVRVHAIRNGVMCIIGFCRVLRSGPFCAKNQYGFIFDCLSE